MSIDPRQQRHRPVSGLMALALSALAATLLQPAPSTSHAAALAAFLAAHRGLLLTQSLLYVLSAAVFIWFLGSLRAFLVDAEEERGSLVAVAFGAGMTWVGLSVVGQVPQLALTLPSQAAIAPGLATLLTDVGFVLLSLANLPLAVMLIAVAKLSLTTRAFPRSLGWLSVLAAAAAVTLAAGVIDPAGLLAPSGWVNYALSPVFGVWLVSVSVVMMRRAGARAGRGDDFRISAAAPAFVPAPRSEGTKVPPTPDSWP